MIGFLRRHANRYAPGRPRGLVRWPADWPADTQCCVQSLASGAALRSAGPFLRSARIPALRWLPGTRIALARFPTPAAALAPVRSPVLLPTGASAEAGVGNRARAILVPG